MESQKSPFHRDYFHLKVIRPSSRGRPGLESLPSPMRQSCQTRAHQRGFGFSSARYFRYFNVFQRFYIDIKIDRMQIAKTKAYSIRTIIHWF
jgi:hypothetical protein